MKKAPDWIDEFGNIMIEKDSMMCVSAFLENYVVDEFDHMTPEDVKDFRYVAMYLQHFAKNYL